MSPTLRSRLCFVATAALLTATGTCNAAGWWNPAFPHRRTVTADEFEPTALEGDDVAVVTFPTAGRTRPDAADIRVIARGGRSTPHRVLMTGPGDLVRVAFALRGRVRRYHVYFGHPHPPETPPLEIRRGVLLEMWEHPGGGTKTLTQIERLFKRTGKLIGRDFRERIFLGHNPFGARNRAAAIYTGYLVCPTTGKYTFSTSSSNASFLLIDEKLVVDNGGSHRPQRDVRMQGDVELTAGMHKLTLYHVSGSREFVAVVAWRPPGKGGIRPIPPLAFAPVVHASPGPIEDYGRSFSIDFLPEHRGEAFMMNRYYQRYAFKALAVGRSGRSIRLRWDFGDGQTSDEPEVEHVYLLDGSYTVTLTATNYAGETARTNRIHVTRLWDQVTLNRVDPLGRHANIVEAYDFERIAPAGMVQAMRLLKRTKRTDALLKAGEAFIRRERVYPGAVEQVVTEYADALVSRHRPYDAVAALRKGATMTTSPNVCAKLLTRAGRVLLDQRSDTPAALDLFQQTIRRYASLASVRDARIGVGDVWRTRGDYARALEAYRSAGTRLETDPAKAAIRKGDFARHVEDFLRRRKYEHTALYLDRWESTFPIDRLAGYSTLLRVRLGVARREYGAAAREAEALVTVNPGSNYAPELLMLAAESYTALGQTGKARTAFERIVKNYPESPLVPEASRKLGPR